MHKQNPIQTALITGGNGNLGRLTADRLLADGKAVIRFDIPGTEPATTRPNETIIIGDIRDKERVEAILSEHQPDTIYHLASLLSGSSEADHEAAWEINATASFHLLKLAVKHGVQTFFFAGTNASYGGGLADPMPEDAMQWPENIYGATKVAVERLGVFFKLKNDLDFRVLRFPMVLSPFAPTTAVTAYPSHAIRAAINNEPFTFPVSAQTGMSTMFLDDVVNSIIDFTYAPRTQIKQHGYNLHSYFMSVETLIAEIQHHKPEFNGHYDINPVVEALINNWPNDIIDQQAREDWGWNPRFDLGQSVARMFELITPK